VNHYNNELMFISCAKSVKLNHAAGKGLSGKCI